MLDIALSAIVAAGVLAYALSRFTATDYEGPEEPWLDWDGEIPLELDSRPMNYTMVPVRKVVYPEGWVHGVNWDARPPGEED